jgi:hypothetical protein
MQYIPSLPVRRSSGPGIERIKGPTKPALIQGQMNSSKLMVLREMKSIFQDNLEQNSEFNIKSILKPLTEEELEAITLNEEELIKKEEEAISNQINRLKKQKDEKIDIENLKPPQ